MKKILLVFTALSFCSAQAQTINGGFLDINMINARFNADGSLFSDFGSTFTQGFEAPKGSNHHTFFAAGLWLGGFDAGSALKLAAQTYHQSGTDYWPGPLTASATTDSATIAHFNRVWKINKCDIDTYVNWFNGGQIGVNPTDSTAMNTIMNWPAFSPFGLTLAPFVDVNTNAIYDPAAGDYPLIKGDQAIFFVFNDRGGVHTETGGSPIGLEVQAMAYAYACPADSTLQNAIFTNYKVYNRGAFLLDSVFVEHWSDVEIGGSSDDFVGSDVTRGAYYAFNGDAVDGNLGSELGYGNNPPAQAVVFLNGPFAKPNGLDDPASATPNGTNYGDGTIDNERLGMSRFMYYQNDFSAIGNPVTATDFYNYMTGSWKDATSLTYGGNGHLTGVNCKYMFPGTSDPMGFGTGMAPQPAWDEITAGNTPGDRRAMGAYGPFILQPGASNEMDFAYVFARANSGGNLASVAIMKDRIDSVRQKYTTGITACGCSTSAGIASPDKDDPLRIYPNPASDYITISYAGVISRIKIYDVMGREVRSFEINSKTEKLVDISGFPKGVYIIGIQSDTKETFKRFIKN
ncbi:MAG: T9SS type A sorting domain-containing protein [Bacteroidia bacterium]